MTKTVFKNLSRKQLADIVHKAINALADSRCYDTFEFELFTDGDESTVEIIKEADDGND